MNTSPIPLRGPGVGIGAGGPSFSVGNRVFRAAWSIAWLLLAAWTPPPLAGWRRLVLLAFGAKVHPRARVYGSARIWYPPLLQMNAGAVLGPRSICYCMAMVTLGERATISQGAHLCAGTHDVDEPQFPLIARPITIGTGAWVAAEAFVGPGVSIGDNAVLGARAVTFKDLPAGSVNVGNPARAVRVRRGI